MIDTSQLGSVEPLRACFRIDVAPTISSVRNCLLPRQNAAVALSAEPGDRPDWHSRGMPLDDSPQHDYHSWDYRHHCENCRGTA